jgi:predicted nuclease of restriction endonuclease-like (RecB) superfamily
MSENKDLQTVPQTPEFLDETEFFKSIFELIQQARRNVEKHINTAMIVTYYEIGRCIIEKEQQGKKRAQYGKRIIQGLSDYLTATLGKGYSVENLKLMRRFYKIYSERIIGQSPITQFSPNISWTHYIQLMRITDGGERSFYELEIADNNWSVKEFQRQFDSSLYERLALSRDKEKVRELASNGQIIESPQDLFKDPYVLELLACRKKPRMLKQSWNKSSLTTYSSSA